MQEFMLLKVAGFFIENPYKEVYLRELAEKLKVAPFTVMKYTEFLLKEGLIKEERRANLRYFKANAGGLFFRHLKIAFNVRNISNSGIIEFLKENMTGVSSIVLFGSMAKGEDDGKSDVDMLVIGKKRGQMNLRKFSDKIGKEITLHVLSWSEWNEATRKNEAFYADVIIYGIPLYGERPLVKWK
jgi:predicted nucleotidyltransferase